MTRPGTTQLDQLIARISAESSERFNDANAFHQWSCQYSEQFWQAALASFNVPYSGSASPGLSGSGIEATRFFPELRFNPCQWLLWQGTAELENTVAVTVCREDGTNQSRTRSALRERAMRVAACLEQAGIKPGDRVAALGANSIEMIEAFLGTVAVGACWSSVGPDLGADAVLARFGQLSPTVAFVDESYTHHGRTHDLRAHLNTLIRELPSLRLIVRLRPVHDRLDVPGHVICLEDCQHTPGTHMDALEHRPFNHPMLILFTSGTTGKPKCLVHGAGGTLIEHLKEHRLHGNYGPLERLLYISNCGWMMWNWALSSLASAMPLVLYDGSPNFPSTDGLLGVLEREAITVFGASPAYFQLLQQLGSVPAEQFDLSQLHTILSTGSVLHEQQFSWLEQAFGGARVESISGGTDIVGCFVLGHPHRPAVRGDSSGPSLGMALAAATDDEIKDHGEGDLVCRNAFPSRPLGIWGDHDGVRLHEAYYAVRPGVWSHGDRVLIRPGGSVRMLGRSDGVMNIRGVRIGPAELQSVAITIDGVRDAMASCQPAPDELGGERIVLLLVLEDSITLDRPMILRIKRAIRDATSANHVPARIEAIPELPVTHSGKPAESAVRAALSGKTVQNTQAIRNPDVLALIARLA